nr:folylpolyglutamate synthase-like [Tanacetum cinerariifolium]
MIILLFHIETNRLAIILSSTRLQRTGHLEFKFKSIDQTSYLPEQFIKGLTTASLQGRAQVVPDRACDGLGCNISSIKHYR